MNPGSVDVGCGTRTIEMAGAVEMRLTRSLC